MRHHWPMHWESIGGQASLNGQPTIDPLLQMHLKQEVVEKDIVQSDHFPIFLQRQHYHIKIH